MLRPTGRGKSNILVSSAMWTEKLSAGVLRVLTPMGPRYLNPSLSQRVYLLWMFRHFEKLPLQVLNRRQQRLIGTLWAEQRFVSLLHEETPILGTLERRPPAEVEAAASSHSSDHVSDAGAAFAAELRQRS
ncbi:MAG TPA: hypothetical protein VK639_16825 [Terriglobales bacterium]|nr:hypothetical protein [Terriglobales bacterium]